MATITGQEAIIRDGKIIGAPIVSAQANKVLVIDGNGAIVGSDVPATKLSDIMGQFYIDEDGDLCQL